MKVTLKFKDVELGLTGVLHAEVEELRISESSYVLDFGEDDESGHNEDLGNLQVELYDKSGDERKLFSNVFLSIKFNTVENREIVSIDREELNDLSIETFVYL